MDAQLTRGRFIGDDYHRMADGGILDEDDPDRMELIDGEIVATDVLGSRNTRR